MKYHFKLNKQRENPQEVEFEILLNFKFTKLPFQIQSPNSKIIPYP